MPERVAVIGAGLMGHGIAQVFAQAGSQVVMQDVDTTALGNARERIRSNLSLLFEGRPDCPVSIDKVMSRIISTESLAEAVGEADLIIESISENLELKIDVFKTIESLAPEDAIMASNTSMLRISDIGRWVKDKKRLVIAHWFNPPYLIPVVEVVKGADTSPETWERMVDILKRAGKMPVKVLKEVPGHLLNRIQFALLRETLSLLQDGVATVEEIDKAVSGSLGLRLATIGPLRGMDLTGIEIFWYGLQNLHTYGYESPDPRKIIEERIKAGRTGRKSGKGFYEYEQGGVVSREETERDKKLMKLLEALYPWQEAANA